MTTGSPTPFVSQHGHRAFTLSTQLDYFLTGVSRPDNLRPAAAAATAATGHSHPADGKSGHAGFFTFFHFPST